MPEVLQGEAEDDEGDGHESCGWIYDCEAGFGLDAAVVAGHVEAAEEVVEPVPGELADEGAGDETKVEETCR